MCGQCGVNGPVAGVIPHLLTSCVCSIRIRFCDVGGFYAPYIRYAQSICVRRKVCVIGNDRFHSLTLFSDKSCKVGYSCCVYPVCALLVYGLICNYRIEFAGKFRIQIRKHFSEFGSETVCSVVVVTSHTRNVEHNGVDEIRLRMTDNSFCCVKRNELVFVFIPRKIRFDCRQICGIQSVLFKELVILFSLSVVIGQLIKRI